MNKQQKEVQQAHLNNEKAVLEALKQNYEDALLEINSNLQYLMARQDADMQHVIYQAEYQRAVKDQIEGILNQLNNSGFETVSEYLTHCYEEGFVGTMYDLQSQGIPLIFPIDQEKVVQAIQHDTKLSSSLYAAFDMKDLKKKISGEISRGISSASTYNEIARNISGYANVNLNNAMRIARTEGHRINIKSAMDAQQKAREKGADVVKQWDASLDGKTRPHHRELDGQIRELDEEFEYSGGSVSAPAHFGIPSEDINCRCALLQRARWALGNDITKYSPDAVEEISDDGVTKLEKIKAKDYGEFKKKYMSEAEKMEYEKKASERVRSNAQKINSAVKNADDKTDPFGKHVHFKTGGMTTKEYIESKNPLTNFKSVPDAEAVPTARKAATEWIESIDDKAKKLINRYTYNQNDDSPKFYQRINTFIRNGYKGEKDYTEQVNIISNALKKSKLKHSYKCYRGSDFNPFEGMKVGETKTVDQFFSTSLKSSGSFEGKYTILVYAEEGTNAAYIEELSAEAFKKQREMLFDKDVIYELLYQKDDLIIVRTKP